MFAFSSQTIHSSNPRRLCSAALLIFSKARERALQESCMCKSPLQHHQWRGALEGLGVMLGDPVEHVQHVQPKLEIQSTYSMKLHEPSCLFNVFISGTLQFLDPVRCKSWKRFWTSRRGSIQSSLAAAWAVESMSNRIVGLSSEFEVWWCAA